MKNAYMGYVLSQLVLSLPPAAVQQKEVERVMSREWEPAGSRSQGRFRRNTRYLQNVMMRQDSLHGRRVAAERVRLVPAV